MLSMPVQLPTIWYSADQYSSWCMYTTAF